MPRSFSLERCEKWKDQNAYEQSVEAGRLTTISTKYQYGTVRNTVGYINTARHVLLRYCR